MTKKMQCQLVQIRSLEQSRDRLKERVKQLEYDLAAARLIQKERELAAQQVIASQAKLISEKTTCLMLANRVCHALHIWYQAVDDSRKIPNKNLFEKLMHAYHEWRGE